MDAVLVLNVRSGTLSAGGGDLSPDAICREFAAHGARVTVQLTKPGETEAALRSAAAGRAGAIIVGGGDGTVSTAARCMAGTGVPLGVLPLGTLNHFASDIGLPSDWKSAVAVLSRGVPRTIDVGEVNGRVFVNNCSLGAYPEAVLRRDALRRAGRRKWFAMALAVLAEFYRLRRIRFELELPTGVVSLRSPFVLISNNQYSGHVLAERLRPRLDEGMLWIYTTRESARFQLLRLAWQSLVHSIDAADGLETHAVDSAVIRTRFPRLPVGVDGEVVSLASPLKVRIMRQALCVLGPPQDRAQPDGPAVVAASISSLRPTAS